MRQLLASIAVTALVIGSAPALAKNDHGGGNGGGNGHAMHGNGNGNGNGKGPGKANERGNSAAVRIDMPGARAAVNGNVGHGKAADHAKVRMDAPVRADLRANGNGPAARVLRGDDGDAVNIVRRGDKIERVSWTGFSDRFERGGLIDGCPPGLAKKNNGCMPPGQVKDASDWRMDSSWWGLRGVNDLRDYRYYDGNLVRFAPNGTIASYYPLLGGALALGNVWPSAYAPVNVDPYYVDYYGLGSDYRYYDNTLYRLDPGTNAIAAVAALLTGDEFAVGSRLPAGYDVYNVPYGYRDRYVDGPDAMYRYSDGYVYEVDPKTRLIVAALELLS